MQRVAVMDMGSNSWRLVVYGYEPGTWWRVVDEIREAVRVGEGLGEELTLKPKPMERALHTASVFAAFCRASGVGGVLPVATSAIRDARNRDELLGAIEQRTGLAVRVLSSEEEAWYGFLAIADSTTIDHGAGLDIGGGSIQAMRIERRGLEEAISLPLGAVRATEAFLPDDRPTKKQMAKLREHVAERLEQLDLGRHGRRMVGVGGTIRNLAAAAQRAEGHPPTGVQGYVMTRDALEDLIGELSSRPPAKRGAVPGIKDDRGDVILGGALVLAGAMDAGGFDGIEATRAGLREGVFLERYLGDARAPVIADVRGDSVDRLAAHYRDDRRHDRHVARLSLEIYDGLGAAGIAETDPADRELLHAACLLHDIGVAIDYDDHHKHSQYLVMHAGLPGFSPRELLLIALIARYHRKGEPDASELGSLARDDDEERLALLSGVIRLAEQLERSRDGSIRSVRVTAPDGRVRLEAHAAGDPTVPLWAARREAGLLSSALGRDVEVVRAA